MEHDKFKPYYKVKPILVNATKRELDEFLDNYPRPLSTDYFVGVITWNDFSIAPMWPDSIVAARNIEFEHNPDESGYARIASNMMEVFNSIEKI